MASLLDSEAAVPGVTTGDVAEPLRSIAVVKRVDGRPIDPVAGHLAVTAGWGHLHKRRVMPGKGKVDIRGMRLDTEPVRPERSVSGVEGSGQFGVNGPSTGSGRTDLFGGKTCDIYLNNDTYWHNIPEVVWDYTIGGYQVIKKWLSYRERDLLGRDLTLDEVRHVTEMARRIAAILMLRDELDANYRATASDL